MLRTHLKLPAVTLLAAFLGLTSLYGQDEFTVYVVSPSVGPQIDLEEKIEYRILNEFPKSRFKYAEVLVDKNGNYVLRATFTDDTQTSKVITQDYLNELKGKLDERDTYVVYTIDGLEIEGKLVRKSEDTLYVDTGNRLARIAKVDILRSEVQDRQRVVNGKYRFPNPIYARYLISASGYPLGKGEGYYQNLYLFFNSAYFGVTNNISVGGGFEILSLLAGFPFGFVTVKASGELVDGFYLGGGALLGGVASVGGFGSFFGTATVGNKDHQASLNVGWTLAGGEFSSSPTFTLSGFTRVGRGLALVSENWFLPSFDETVFLGALAIRILGRRMSFDGGLIFSNIFFDTDLIAFPIVSYSVKF